jgi:phycoerythrin-associated linker protein
MDITEFVEKSIGHWRSQRSAHHLAFAHFEAVQSEIDIIALSATDPAVLELCSTYHVDPGAIASPFRMSWEGQSDWEDSEAVKGTCVLVQGYAETIAAVGEYSITEDGTFVLITAYERAAAEEKIWFVNPNVRCRVSLIKTSAGTGVVTASFSSEIRQVSSGS